MIIQGRDICNTCMVFRYCNINLFPFTFGFPNIKGKKGLATRDYLTSSYKINIKQAIVKIIRLSS